MATPNMKLRPQVRGPRRPLRKAPAAPRARSSGGVEPRSDPTEVFSHEDIVRGIMPTRIKQLMDRGVLDAKQVYRVIPERTFSRRLVKRERLKVSESDAINRLVRVTADAERTFGDVGFAKKWLSLPNPALKDRSPIAMAETDVGAREVEVILTRIAHGVYS